MSKPTFLGPLIGKGAGQYELVNADQGSVLAAHVEPAFDSKARKRGLLGRDAVPEDYALILAPCSGIHTFSMRFPMDAVFVSRDGTVVKTCRELKPWRIAVAWRAFAVIEAAAGFIERTEIVPGEAVALREIPQNRRVTGSWPALAIPPAAAGGGARVRQADTQKRVTLADVIARRTPLAWFESVAIVQELCEAVLARGRARDPRVPELKHIALTPDGAVELLGEGPAEHSPVHRASLVLLALTPEAELPTQLRLLALEEVSPRPKLGDLKDLHRELEFFERPDRREIIRGVSERFWLQPAQGAAEATVPPPLLEPPPPKRRNRWWRNESVWAGLVIVLLTGAAASAVWAWRRPEGQWMRAGVSRAATAATSTGQTVAREASKQLELATWKLGLNRRPATSPPPIDIDARVPVPVASPSGRAADSRAPQLPGLSLPTGHLQPTAPGAEPAISRPAAATATPSPVSVAAGAESAPSQPAGALPTVETIYSAVDPLVVPPKLVRPNATRVPPPGVRIEDMAEVEVLVSPIGDVNSVKLVSRGTDPHPAMMLSVIKAWRFQPATRGGQPVPYRLRLRLPAR